LIICQTCGTTNNEAVSHTCRKCGALLPVTPKSHRKKLKTESKKKETKKKVEQKPKETVKPVEKKKETLELQEIPKESEIIRNNIKLDKIPTSVVEEIEDHPSMEEIQVPEVSKLDGLQEIPVQPYRSTIISSSDAAKKKPSLPTPPLKSKDVISDAFSELKNSVLEYDEKILKAPLEPTKSDISTLKQKQLEKDMTEVLGFLSKKISVKKLDIPKAISPKKREPEQKIPPSNMNEILNQLLNLDLNIEASAIIKTDGTILASAISSRISDSLFATIGMNLSMIGSDIIDGLDAGDLKSISVKGTDGVVDLAPIDRKTPSVQDMILILFSHPKVKSGIIAFAVNIVKKQLIEYLGI
jgi:predicted regulator of Ras-like GTPase activity (Roadblock/LC7/MglB family)